MSTFLLAGLFLSLLFFTRLSMIDILFWCFFLCSLLFHWDSRIAIGGALFCLVVFSVFLIAQKPAWAETIAVYVYYFLVIGVFNQMIEYIRERKGES